MVLNTLSQAAFSNFEASQYQNWNLHVHVVLRSGIGYWEQAQRAYRATCCIVSGLFCLVFCIVMSPQANGRQPMDDEVAKLGERQVEEKKLPGKGPCDLQQRR